MSLRKRDPLNVHAVQAHARKDYRVSSQARPIFRACCASACTENDYVSLQARPILLECCGSACSKRDQHYVFLFSFFSLPLRPQSGGLQALSRCSIWLLSTRKATVVRVQAPVNQEGHYMHEQWCTRTMVHTSNGAHEQWCTRTLSGSDRLIKHRAIQAPKTHTASYCRPFSHELSGELQVVTLGSSLLCCVCRRGSSAASHSRPFSHELVDELKVMTSESYPFCCLC